MVASHDARRSTPSLPASHHHFHRDVALAVEHKAVNLGQGFPDLDGPEAIRAVAAGR